MLRHEEKRLWHAITHISAAALGTPWLLGWHIHPIDRQSHVYPPNPCANRTCWIHPQALTQCFHLLRSTEEPRSSSEAQEASLPCESVGLTPSRRPGFMAVPSLSTGTCVAPEAHCPADSGSLLSRRTGSASVNNCSFLHRGILSRSVQLPELCIPESPDLQWTWL